jgi:oxygen-dependent protoporphyrinogen oxidase
MRTAIIGAGIGGLTTAFYLLRDRPEDEVHVFEAESIPGGTMRL